MLPKYLLVVNVVVFFARVRLQRAPYPGAHLALDADAVDVIDDDDNDDLATKQSVAHDALFFFLKSAHKKKWCLSCRYIVKTKP